MDEFRQLMEEIKNLKSKVERQENEISFLQNELHQEKVLRNQQYTDIEDALYRLNDNLPKENRYWLKS